MSEFAKYVNRVEFISATVGGDKRIFAYLRLLDGEQIGRSVTLWIDGFNDASNLRLKKIAEVLGDRKLERKMIDAARRGDYVAIGNYLRGEQFTAIWRNGDKPGITFVDDIAP